MSTFLETVERQYGTRDLYAVLGVEKTAEEAELKRAYRRLSLKVHPDRVEPEEVATATEKFQVPLTHHVMHAGVRHYHSHASSRHLARSMQS